MAGTGVAVGCGLANTTRDGGGGGGEVRIMGAGGGDCQADGAVPVGAWVNGTTTGTGMGAAMFICKDMEGTLISRWTVDLVDAGVGWGVGADTSDEDCRARSTCETEFCGVKGTGRGGFKGGVTIPSPSSEYGNCNGWSSAVS